MNITILKKNVSFVELSHKVKLSSLTLETKDDLLNAKSISVEVGKCKINIPKHLGLSCVLYFIQEVNASNI